MITVLYGIATAISIVLGFRFFVEMYPEQRHKGTWSRLLFALMVCFLCGIQVWDAQKYYLSNMGVIIYPILNAIPLTVFCKCKYYVAVLWQWIYYIAIAIFKLPMLMINGIIRGGDTASLNYAARNALEIIWFSMIIILFSLLLLGCAKKTIVDSLKYYLEEYHYLVLVSYVVAWVLFSGMYADKTRFEIDNLIDSFIVCFIVVIIFWYMCRSYRLKKEEEKNIQLQREVLEREQHIIKERYEENAKKLHDIKYEMRCLDKYISDGEYEKARNYLKTYTGKVEQKEKGVWTKIPAVDASIDYYYMAMDCNKIAFELDADVQNIALNEMDLMIILGNLLENAVEAAKKCREKERWIHMKIKNINEMTYIEISNSSAELPKKAGKDFLSSKDKNRAHGYGISNVRGIVESQGGEIHYDYTEQYFQVKVIV